MKRTLLTSNLRACAAAVAAILLLVHAPHASATVIDFTGGTVVRNANPNETTNNSVTWDGVDNYTQNGFKFDFIVVNTSKPFATEVGNYYSAGNDVFHGHWLTGTFGNVTQIKVTKLDNTSFDLNYFLLTSNTAVGGGAATGSELAYIHASSDGVTDDYQQLLPSENWGFPGTAINLGSQFDSVKAIWFTASNAIDCFGMDDFTFDEAGPIAPEPTSLGFMTLGIAALLMRRRPTKPVQS